MLNLLHRRKMLLGGEGRGMRGRSGGVCLAPVRR